ncbi:MAG: biosynthetic-type acetolactate synthase large subunit [Kiritimatiellaeota bacterium]|nr:biosynthetic-type acetolactate synthase large subunit [Kiritimatiellota bacterium]
MKGAEIVIRALEREGVDMIFAYPGGASMELHQALLNSPIRVVLPRHEQGGAFAANGYARATGRVGVCMATSGPGATNLITGIADAYMDSVPLIAITGQVPQRFIGKNAFQETDIIGVTRPIVKHSYLVLNAADIPKVMAEAFYLAASGRPGPVVIDLPKDVQQARCAPDFPARIKLPTYRLRTEPSDAEVEAVREAIRACERPCVYAGGGIIAAGAHQELRKVAEAYNLPVTTTLLGLGAFPESHPLSLKWLGMHGAYYANCAANECDLLLCIGARFDDRVTGNVASFAEHATVVHVDIDPSEINKNKKADIGIVCDARQFLQKLLEHPVRKEYAAWHARIEAWKRDYPFSYNPDEESIQPQHVIETLYELTGGKALIVTGVGQHQMWAGQFYKFERPRQFLTSGGLGAMGFGLPAAIGAKLGCPDALVVCIDGDGSFQMNIQELGTVFAEEVGVKVVILNNQHLGMVAQWEDRFYGSRRGDTVLSNTRVDRPYPDFVQIAKGFFVPGREVNSRDELQPALEEMLAAEGAFVLDVHTGYQEHVLPMIPAGGSYRESILE